MAEETEFMTYREAAQLLAVSLSTIIRATKPGPHGEPPALPVYRIGERVSRVKRSDVLALARPGRIAETPYEQAARHDRYSADDHRPGGHDHSE